MLHSNEGLQSETSVQKFFLPRCRAYPFVKLVSQFVKQSVKQSCINHHLFIQVFIYFKFIFLSISLLTVFAIFCYNLLFWMLKFPYQCRRVTRTHCCEKISLLESWNVHQVSLNHNRQLPPRHNDVLNREKKKYCIAMNIFYDVTHNRDEEFKRRRNKWKCNTLALFVYG